MRQLSRDPIVGPLVRARPGLRVAGTWDAFETGVRAIVRQDSTRAGTNAAIAHLVERHGTPVAGLQELGLTHTFPRPETLADALLTDVGISAATAAAIRAFAAATADGVLRLDRSVKLDQLVASIKALPGVAMWTAHYMALRLGEADAIPLSDHELDRCLPERSHPTRAARAAIVDRWRPWRALAVTHLWVAGSSREPIARKGAA